MAATANRAAPRRGAQQFTHHGPVNGGAHIFAGTMITRDAQGNVIACTNSTAPPQGCALHEADNSDGSDGDLTVEFGEGTYGFLNDGSNPVTAAMVGSVCFVKDDQTVGATAVGNVIAGRVDCIEDGLVYVLVGNAFTLNEALS